MQKCAGYIAWVEESLFAHDGIVCLVYEVNITSFK